MLAKGDNKGAWKILPRTIDISQDMARQLIQKLIEAGIDYVVAPYEADVQMAYLVKEGYAHFAISEDSDLILYGCKYVFYKLSNEGSGVLYQNNLILDCLGKEKDKFDFPKFRRMCILSGCDYLTNLTGVGLKKAKKFFETVNSDVIEKCLPQLPKILNMKKLTVPSEYIEKYIQAENTFQHQLVFCPKEKKLRPFLDYDENLLKGDLDYAGSYFDEDLALNLAFGNVDFKKLEIFDENFLDKINEKYFNSKKSIWNDSYKLDDPKRFDKILKRLRPNFEIPKELITTSTSGSTRRGNKTETDKTKERKGRKEIKAVEINSEDDEVVEDKSDEPLSKLSIEEESSQKRKYEVLDSSIEEEDHSSHSFTKLVKEKKQKLSNESRSDKNDDIIIVESSFKIEKMKSISIKSDSNCTTVKSEFSNSTSITSKSTTEDDSNEVKVEVKSRFFASEQNTLDKIKERRQAIRNNLQKMYKTPLTNSQCSTDSGYSSQPANSQNA